MTETLIARVREVIHDSGMTQNAFAESIATTPDKLSKSLAGQRRFSTTELALIAESAQRTVDWVITGKAVHFPSMAASAVLSTTSGAAEIAETVERFNAASEQLALLSEPARNMVNLPDIVRSGGSVNEAAELAAAAAIQLDSLGLDIIGERDLSITLEKAFSVDIAIEPLPKGLDGCSWQTENTRLIVLAPTTNWARQRFTLAHELGHILAGDSYELIAEPVYPHGSGFTEKRANCFAAALLMPEARLRASAPEPVSEESFSQLVNEFRVSPESMASRLHKLGMLSLKDMSLYRTKTAESCALSQQRADLVNRERTRAQAKRLPSRLVDEHMRYYFEGMTSARPLASLLGISSQEVADLLGVRAAKSA